MIHSRAPPSPGIAVRSISAAIVTCRLLWTSTVRLPDRTMESDRPPALLPGAGDRHRNAPADVAMHLSPRAAGHPTPGTRLCQKRIAIAHGRPGPIGLDHPLLNSIPCGESGWSAPLRQDHGCTHIPELNTDDGQKRASAGPACHAGGRPSGAAARTAYRTVAIACSTLLATACSLGSDPATVQPRSLVPTPPGLSGPPLLDPFVPPRETIIAWV